MTEVYIINESPFELPSYATIDSAGVDLKAFLDKPMELKPLERKIIGTGIKLALPEGFEAQVRPRSGLAAKHGISILNSPGTIDSDYRGEIGVILVNLSNQTFTVNRGDRIAQLVLAKYEKINWKIIKELPKTNRGFGGFGSTGEK
ncbi:MAG: dUTP diphosphatase [Bacteroidota bacterium]|nr:dUTP diphosphatase [Bacteroidota bacterium]MEC8599849.1 dUTP diphosphatase [Bacteroidota bacterium]|tara:strand:+ start:46 stop:483 length:438 start_codon:yes stop_codon:yes gene_type:complete